jgi:uncharacterized protein (TIGR00730 family)
MRRLCVFCGSSFGAHPDYERAARELAEVAVREGVGLVYGGAHCGLMGALADRALQLGGEVIGVIPIQLVEQEIAHNGLSQLHEVRSMHERKALMASLSDGFIALPGGIGTLEELTEILTWRQLELHHKPIALLNTRGYFDGLLALLAHMREQRFLPPPTAAALGVAETPAAALDWLRAAERELQSHDAR